MKVFKEEQRFTQLWLHILLIVSFLLPVVLVINELIKANSKSDSKVSLIVVLGSILLIYGFIFSLKLKTRIDEIGIHYRFIPFHFSDRLIKWDEVKSAFVRYYNPISDYGGWGIKGGTLWIKDKGIVYNVKGNIGLQLILKNGKKILIGTQKEQEVKSILVSYQEKISNSQN